MILVLFFYLKELIFKDPLAGFQMGLSDLYLMIYVP